jgi:hypothetical protein
VFVAATTVAVWVFVALARVARHASEPAASIRGA